MAGISPQPIPTSIGITPVQNGAGEKFVVLEISTAFGTVFPHLDPDGARSLAEALTAAANTLSTGLILPGANGGNGSGLVKP